MDKNDDDDNVFSMRIFFVDYYLTYPLTGFDPCYSEFRGHEIKSVPVIRIFGPNKNGKKSCMHIHGILPYFYIPYESKNFNNFDQASYQLSLSIDKALNISFGQANSSKKHVFKIQLVKGIPLYGYHGKEHLFLKIFFYNPRYIKCAATLLQNGIIMGKVFQPHEAHIPFVLQFLIDFNLYGMSYIHVPSRIISSRINTVVSDDCNNDTGINMKLGNFLKRMTTSEYEFDINAKFILNRFYVNNKTNNMNPGIESIWQDEINRRKKMCKDDEIPPLDIPVSQERLLLKLPESEIFYKEVLNGKVYQNICTRNITDEKSYETNKATKFGVKSLLVTSVYPEECTQNSVHDNLINASTIYHDHLSSSTTQNMIENKTQSNQNNDNDISIIDEELILTLSQNNKKQNETLQSKDYEVLEILRNLEEDTDNNGGNTIDLDSTLAALTPESPSKLENNTKLEKKLKNIIGVYDRDLNEKEGPIVETKDELDENYDDNEIDFTDITLSAEHINKLLLQIDETTCQLDGNFDIQTGLVKSNNKNSKRLEKNNSTLKSSNTNNSSTKSPNKSNSCLKSPNKNNSSSKSSNKNNSKVKYKPLTITTRRLSTDGKELRTRSRDSTNNDISKNQLGSGQRTTSFTFKPNVIKRDQHKRRLQFDDLQENNSTNNGNGSNNGFSESSSLHKLSLNKKSKTNSNEVFDASHGLKKLQIRLKRIKNLPDTSLSQNKNETVSHTIHERRRSVSDVAREYDRRNNFFPEPGPSHINYYTLIETPNRVLSHKVESKNDNREDDYNHNNNDNNGNDVNNNDNNNNDNNDDDMPIKSFYENSYFIDSPTTFSQKSLFNINASCKDKSYNNVIKPDLLPPKHDGVLNNLIKYNIPEVENVEPFYGVSDDLNLGSIAVCGIKTTTVTSPSSLSKRKEIGNKILQLHGNTLNDCEEFCSLTNNLNSLNEQRRQQFLSNANNNKLISNLKEVKNYKIKEYLCNNSKVIISTKDSPPNGGDASQWFKNPNTKNKQNNPSVINRNKNGFDNDKKENNKCRVKIGFSQSNKSNDKNQNTNNTRLCHKKILVKLRNISKNDQLLKNKNSCKINKLKKRIPFVKLRRINENILKNYKIDNDENLAEEKRNLNTKICKTSNNSKVNCSELENSIKTILTKSLTSCEHSFGLSGPTLENTFGFKFNLDNFQNVKSDIEPNFLTVMSLEIFVPTRNDLKPNPQFDSINCIFYSIINNNENAIENFNNNMITGYIIVKDSNLNQMKLINNDNNDNDTTKMNSNGILITYVKNENELINELINLCNKYDPDVLAGYEIEHNSWGYVIDRGKYLNTSLISKLSRAPFKCKQRHKFDTKNDDLNKMNIFDDDKEQIDIDVETKLNGRILLNLWRLMRSEISLTSYTFENVMYHIMHKRISLHSHKNLTKWYHSNKTNWIVIDYYLKRVKGNLELLNQLDLIDRTCEMAKLIGIQFYEILSRGSQYRVESMMLRMAKPKNFVPLSPSVKQRAHMKAPEYLPLILEPESRFYVDPVIVLDFQSLYPSMIIAYNYCFSTCLGRVQHLGHSEPFEFGASQLRISQSDLKFLIENDFINVSPCGVAFVKSNVRNGVLAKMLQEILDTRLMVKRSMKLHKNNSTLQKVLHSRQLGLKLMANVTYGYTAANFSGRMPCVEVGDSIVSKGRETLERAIKLIQNNQEWNVKIIYGDTDSIFVLVPGRSKETAFKIGEQISEAVTKDNPKPVKLKLEKVYQPCILQTKKRYVGYMYESADQSDPVYEAKGIETVRRDGCPAVAKILEKSLRILFETRDVNKVKNYVCRQFTKILCGQTNIQDLIFAKEFRGIHGYKPGACVPALELTRKWLQIDPRREPRKGERVPFIIVNGPPNVPLIRLVRCPLELLSNDGLKINGLYYITKAIIPPLNRCLLLIGADANEWFMELPRKNISLLMLSTASEVMKNVDKNLKKTIISQYFSSKSCIIECGRYANHGICVQCKKNVQKCVLTLNDKLWKIDRSYNLTRKICESCCGRNNNIECLSLDCPVLYILNLKQNDTKQIEYYNKLLKLF